MILVLTCEHAFPNIPEEYQYLFEQDLNVLETHEAYDPGAFDLFQDLRSLSSFHKYQNVGRLLIETNRSLGHQKLFSRYSKSLNKEIKTGIVDTYYQPYRKEIKETIEKYMKTGHEVLHFSVHTFTPVLDDIERNADIGLLYDPQRIKEKKFCKYLKEEINKINPDLKVRFNYPYLGKADGFTSSLRKLFKEDYLGIEVEVNQKWVSNNKMESSLKNALTASLKNTLNKKPQK